MSRHHEARKSYCVMKKNAKKITVSKFENFQISLIQLKQVKGGEDVIIIEEVGQG